MSTDKPWAWVYIFTDANKFPPTIEERRDLVGQIARLVAEYCGIDAQDIHFELKPFSLLLLWQKLDKADRQSY